MNLNSPKQTVHTSSKEIFEFLSDVKNFEKLMPENISKFEIIGEDRFVFALSGMPEVALQLKEKKPYETLVLGAAGGKLDFNLSADITELSPDKSEVQFLFDGEFNAMIGMMIKGPINKLIETLVINLAKVV